jgi:hypothetical protein
MAASFAVNHPRDFREGITPHCSKITRNGLVLVGKVTERMRITVNKEGLYENKMH